MPPNHRPGVFSSLDPVYVLRFRLTPTSVSSSAFFLARSDTSLDRDEVALGVGLDEVDLDEVAAISESVFLAVFFFVFFFLAGLDGSGNGSGNEVALSGDGLEGRYGT